MRLLSHKNKLLLLTALLTLGVSSCGAGSKGPTYSTGEKVFIYSEDALYSVDYDLSVEEGYNINISMPDLDDVTKVNVGRVEAEAKEYGFKDGILTLAGSFLSKVSSGEQEISVTPKTGRAVKVSALFCDKIIKTAQDFQDIENDLDGTYALANDIDFTGFGNFEPLGVFYSEQDNRRHDFHGILEGNGYSIKNLNCVYSQNPSQSDGSNSLDSNKDAYDGTFGFKSEAHKAGDNIGVFQIIGSSGVVRNLVFDNVNVLGRTIVGVVAGNVRGTVENVLIKENCRVKMNTHFYDNDCNTGAAFGIVSGGATVKNCVSLTSNVTVSGLYQDYGPDYAGKIGNGWDHSATEGNTDNWWRFAGVNRKTADNSGDEVDSNGSKTNGVYSFAGKCWGTVENSYGLAFKVTPRDGAQRDVFFGQTHLGAIKPSSGDSDLGQFNNCSVLSLDQMKEASRFVSFDTAVWVIANGSLPSLKAPQIRQGTIK